MRVGSGRSRPTLAVASRLAALCLAAALASSCGGRRSPPMADDDAAGGGEGSGGGDWDADADGVHVDVDGDVDGDVDADVVAIYLEEPRDVAAANKDLSFQIAQALPMRPLFDGTALNSRSVCSSIVLQRTLLLSAGHCVDESSIVAIGSADGRIGPSPIVIEPTLAARYCMFDLTGRCTGTAPDRDADRDLATLFATGAPLSTRVVRVARVTSSTMPQMYLLGYRGLTERVVPRAVCRAETTNEGTSIAPSETTVSLGDSGGVLVGFIDDEPVVVGVVSYRRQGTQRWFLGRMPARSSLPSPSGTALRHPIEQQSSTAFQGISACAT